MFEYRRSNQKDRAHMSYETSRSSESSLDDDVIEDVAYNPPEYDSSTLSNLQFIGCGPASAKIAFLKNALPTRSSGRSARNAICRISPVEMKTNTLPISSSEDSTDNDSDDQSNGSDNESSASLDYTEELGVCCEEEPEIRFTEESQTRTHTVQFDGIEYRQVLADGRARFFKQGAIFLDSPYNWNADTLPVQCIHASHATGKTVSLVELKELSMCTMLAKEIKFRKDTRQCCLYFTRNTIASLFSTRASDIRTMQRAQLMTRDMFSVCALDTDLQCIRRFRHSAACETIPAASLLLHSSLLLHKECLVECKRHRFESPLMRTAIVIIREHENLVNGVPTSASRVILDLPASLCARCVAIGNDYVWVAGVREFVCLTHKGPRSLGIPENYPQAVEIPVAEWTREFDASLVATEWDSIPDDDHPNSTEAPWHVDILNVRNGPFAANGGVVGSAGTYFPACIFLQMMIDCFETRPMSTECFLCRLVDLITSSLIDMSGAARKCVSAAWQAGAMPSSRVDTERFWDMLPATTHMHHALFDVYSSICDCLVDNKSKAIQSLQQNAAILKSTFGCVAMEESERDKSSNLAVVHDIVSCVAPIHDVYATVRAPPVTHDEVDAYNGTIHDIVWSHNTTLE